MRKHGVQNTKATPKFSRIILNDKTWDLLISPVSLFTPTFVIEIKNLMEPNISSFSYKVFLFLTYFGPYMGHNSYSPMGTHDYGQMLYVVIIVSDMYG
jgi:hypothetical protein